MCHLVFKDATYFLKKNIYVLWFFCSLNFYWVRTNRMQSWNFDGHGFVLSLSLSNRFWHSSYIVLTAMIYADARHTPGLSGHGGGMDLAPIIQHSILFAQPTAINQVGWKKKGVGYFCSMSNVKKSQAVIGKENIGQESRPELSIFECSLKIERKK